MCGCHNVRLPQCDSPTRWGLWGCRITAAGCIMAAVGIGRVPAGRGLCCRRSATYGYGRLRLSDAGTAGGSWKLTSLKSPIDYIECMAFRRSQSSISFSSHNSPLFILIRRCKFACLCWRGFPLRLWAAIPLGLCADTGEPARVTR